MYRWNPFTNNFDEKGDWFFGGNTLGAKKTLGSIDNQDFGIITNNTERLTVLKNGNVGIGTTKPSSLLSVIGNTETTGIEIATTPLAAGWDSLRIWSQDTVSTLKKIESAVDAANGYGKLLFQTNAAEGVNANGNHGGFEFRGPTNSFLRILNNGSVGIGTTNPGAKLEVVGNTNYAPLKISRASNDKQIGVSYYPAGALSNSNKAWIMGLEENSNDFSFYNWNGSTINNLLYLTNTNNVGIGTTTPTAKLDINSDILRLRTAKTPATAGASGNQGDIAWDNGYLYVCVNTNEWKRAELLTW